MRAQTVNGFVEEKQLGLTLMHEHIFCDLRKPGQRGRFFGNHEEITIENRFEVNYFQNKNLNNLILDEYEKSIQVLKSTLQRLGQSS